jgi:hypothetical protein
MTEQGRVARQERYFWKTASEKTLKYCREELRRATIRAMKREGVIVIEDEKHE